MKKRISWMVMLTLTASSLSACAPAYTASSGAVSNQITLAKDIISRGAAIDLLAVRPDTPDSQFVRLPDCDSVAYWGDVQRVGVAEAARQCLEYDKGFRTFFGGVQLGMLVLALTVIWPFLKVFFALLNWGTV